MSCARFELEALPKLLLGEPLGEPLDPHFDSCDECSRARADYDTISEALQHGDLEDKPGEIWTAALWKTIRNRGAASTAEAPPAQPLIDEDTTHPSDDADLLGAWHAGEKAAGAKLLKRYFDGVHAFFVSKVSSRDAEALIHATFLALLEIRDRPASSSFRALVFGVARNVLRDHYRRNAQERGLPVQEQGLPLDLGAVRPPERTETTWLSGAEAYELLALVVALRGLPPADQELLHLYYWEDLSAIDLADMLGLSQSSVSARLRGARDRLASKLLAIAEADPGIAETIAMAVPDGELHKRLADFGAKIRAASSR